MMEKVSNPPFRSVGHVIGWYISHNPARQRFVNFFEPDRGSKPQHADFSLYEGEDGSPVDQWARIGWTLHTTLKHFTRTERRAFWLRYGQYEKRDERSSIQDIAKTLGERPKAVARMIDRVHDALDQRFAAAELIPAPGERERQIVKYRREE